MVCCVLRSTTGNHQWVHYKSLLKVLVRERQESLCTMPYDEPNIVKKCQVHAKILLNGYLGGISCLHQDCTQTDNLRAIRNQLGSTTQWEPEPNILRNSLRKNYQARSQEVSTEENFRGHWWGKQLFSWNNIRVKETITSL